MAEEVKPEVIKKTQDSLKKHIKKPPLTEKLLKKPPFRFLHDIITSVIRETGFLNGLFSQEELNHENIKDREGKIAFLDKLISAVKIITGIPLSVRATKIVAGHEATKTNELLQAIGHALDKKLDSKDVAQQLRKKGNKKSDPSDSKKSSPREAKQSSESSKERQVNQPEESVEKKKQSSNKPAKDAPSQEEPTEKKKRSSSTSKSVKPKDSSKPAKSKKDSRSDLQKEPEQNNARDNSQVNVSSATKQESAVAGSADVVVEPEKKRSSSAARRASITKQLSEGNSQEHQREQLPQTAPTSVLESAPNDSQDSPHENSTSLTLLPRLSTDAAKPQAAPPPARAPSAAPAQASAPVAPAPVPLARPRTAARVGSARPGAPRVRNRGEAVVVSEDLIKPAPVNLIVEDDNTKQNNEDEDENLVVVENTPLDGPESHQPSAPALSRPSSQQGHLVAQILETQKELEVGATISENGDIQQFHTEIEWEAGKRRERETAMKEVDRMRTLIQTLTRAAHPLGKLLDSLQEDVDNMQRELIQWQNMQVSLEQQLQVEENLSSQASQPLKEQLKQLQQAVRSQLDQIGSAKSNIFSNDDRIRRLLTGGQT